VLPPAPRTYIVKCIPKSKRTLRGKNNTNINKIQNPKDMKLKLVEKNDPKNKDNVKYQLTKTKKNATV
jgi:hypothetical protein